MIEKEIEEPLIDDQALYERLLEFLLRETGHWRHELDPGRSFYHDLGVDGQDGENLLLAFSNEFQVDMSQLKFERHFGPELPFFPLLWIYWRIFTPDRLNAKGQWKMVPITVLDLYRAAQSKIWPNMDDRGPR